jgi:hypothetical protein
MILSTRYISLRDNILPQYKDLYDRQKDKIFEVSGSKAHQAGKFKTEGLFCRARIKSIKCYYLMNEITSAGKKSSSSMKTMKGMARALHKDLKWEDYSPTNSKKFFGVNWKMKPTNNLNIVMSRECRKIHDGINLKRRFEVCI